MKYTRYLAVCTTLVMASNLAVAASPFWKSRTLSEIFNKYYLGVQFGFSNAKYTNKIMKNNYSVQYFDHTGIATHLQIGYHFNPYFATEIGTFFYSRPIFYNYNQNGGAYTPSKSETNYNVMALYARGTLPVNKTFALTALLGPAFVVRRGLSYGNTQMFANSADLTFAYGGGATVKLQKNCDLFLSALFTLARSSKNLPSSLFMGAGLTYSFWSK
jgi:hypothetical protein